FRTSVRRRASYFLKPTRRQTALLPLPKSRNIPKGGHLRAAMSMINTDNTSSITSASTVIGILMDNELLLLEAVYGKRVLRSLQLPADVSEPGRLLKSLWDAGLHSAWVMPATTRSRTATCSWLEQANNHWVVSVHPDPQEPTRPIRALLWPRERN